MFRKKCYYLGGYDHLEDAAKALNSARNMGILDMLGGGFFISAAKHSRIETAQADQDVGSLF